MLDPPGRRARRDQSAVPPSQRSIGAVPVSRRVRRTHIASTQSAGRRTRTALPRRFVAVSRGRASRSSHESERSPQAQNRTEAGNRPRERGGNQEEEGESGRDSRPQTAGANAHIANTKSAGATMRTACPKKLRRGEPGSSEPRMPASLSVRAAQDQGAVRESRSPACPINCPRGQATRCSDTG